MSEMFGALLARVADSDILAALEIIDPENIKGYAELLPRLRRLGVTKSSCQIILSKPPYWEGDVDVSGLDDGYEHKVAIEFVPWTEWLGMSFSVSECDMSEAQIVGWCLNEMTWGGWDQEAIADRFQEIVDLANEALDMIDDGEGEVV